jgi:hypothetical protein
LPRIANRLIFRPIVTQVYQGEPPRGGIGYVVYPDPVLPNYKFCSVDAYWKVKATFGRARRGPFPSAHQVIERAVRLAEPMNFDVWIISVTGR